MSAPLYLCPVGSTSARRSPLTRANRRANPLHDDALNTPPRKQPFTA
ncbi:hypothetical protein [Streptomyces sp. NPDC047071]